MGEIDTEICPDCYGSGFVEGGCDEDTCCCLDEHDAVRCSFCGGDGYVPAERLEEP